MPPAVSAQFERWAPLACALAALGLYGLTLPPTVTLEDAGLFGMVCHSGSIAHPPGYPLYSLVCPLAAHWPGVDPVVGLAWLSAICAAGSVALLLAIARRMGAGTLAASCAALAYAASAAFWSQAIIAEVYTLDTLLAFAAMWLLLRYRDNGRPRELLWLACVVGLGFSNHWPLFLACGPGFAILLAARWRTLLGQLRDPKLAIAIAVAAALGLMPYLWLAWMLFEPHDFAMLPPAESWDDVVAYLTRRMYAGVDANSMAQPLDHLRFLAWLPSEGARQFGPLLGVAALGGALALLARRRHLDVAASTVLLISHSVILALLLGFPFDYHWQGVFRPYPLIAWGMLALWLAAAIDVVERIARRIRGLRWLLLGLPALVALGNWGANDRSSDDFAERFARSVLESLPPNAILFTHGDSWTGALGYEHYVVGVRQDIALYDADGLLFGNRLFDPRLPAGRERAIVDRFLAGAHRPAFYAVRLSHSGPQRRFGFLWQLGERGLCTPPEAHLEFTVGLLHRPQHIAMNQHLRNGLMANMARCALDLAADPNYLALVRALQAEPPGLFVTLAWMVDRTPSPERDAELARLVRRGAAMLSEGWPMTRLEQANASSYIGHAELTLGHLDAAEQYFRQSLATLDSRDTVARWGLARVLQLRHDDGGLRAFVARYPDDKTLEPFRQHPAG